MGDWVLHSTLNISTLAMTLVLMYLGWKIWLDNRDTTTTLFIIAMFLALFSTEVRYGWNFAGLEKDGFGYGAMLTISTMSLLSGLALFVGTVEKLRFSTMALLIVAVSVAGILIT